MYFPDPMIDVSLSVYYPLSCRGARAGFAEVSLVTNAAPTGGHTEATPRTGVAALDSFSLQSLDWSDDLDDLPLVFSFSYFNGQVCHNADAVWLCDSWSRSLLRVSSEYMSERSTTAPGGASLH